MVKVNGGVECFIYLLVGFGTWEREFGMLNRQLYRRTFTEWCSRLLFKRSLFTLMCFNTLLPDGILKFH